jgi:hypothetical protein
MKLFTLTDRDLILGTGGGVGSVTLHINLHCVTHLSKYHYEGNQHHPQGYDKWHVALGDIAYSFEITEAAFERLRAAMA